MYTECPSCNTRFRIGVAQLRAASGQVRCGQCSTIFNAIATLSDDGETPTVSTDQVVPVTVDSPQTLTHQPETEEIRAHRPGPAATVSPATKKPGGFRWVLMNIVLLGAIAVQAGQHFHPQLNEYSVLQPWLTRMCGYIECDTVGWHDVTQISIQDRDVRSHDVMDDALSISLTLVNNAPRQQPYPTLELSFAGLDGQPMAQRRFSPSEYLDTSVTNQKIMPSQEPVPVRFDLIDPGNSATSFRFDLL